MSIPDSVVQWLASGERGASSNTIVALTMGIATGRMSHPHDPDDLCRCVLLLEACPEVAERFHVVGLVSMEWAALIAIWDDLVSTLDAECPGWRKCRRGSAPKTYAKMKQAIYGGAR